MTARAPHHLTALALALSADLTDHPETVPASIQQMLTITRDASSVMPVLVRLRLASEMHRVADEIAERNAPSGEISPEEKLDRTMALGAARLIERALLKTKP